MPFGKPEITIQINKNEHLCVSGYYDNFTFNYYIYSQAFEAWVKQDITLMKKYYPETYENLELMIENEIIKQGSESSQEREAI